MDSLAEISPPPSLSNYCHLMGLSSVHCKISLQTLSCLKCHGSYLIADKVFCFQLLFSQLNQQLAQTINSANKWSFIHINKYKKSNSTRSIKPKNARMPLKIQIIITLIIKNTPGTRVGPGSLDRCWLQQQIWRYFTIK